MVGEKGVLRVAGRGEGFEGDGVDGQDKLAVSGEEAKEWRTKKGTF